MEDTIRKEKNWESSGIQFKKRKNEKRLIPKIICYQCFQANI